MAQIGSCLLEDATLCPEDAWSKQDERSTLKRKQHGTDGIAAHPFFFSTTPVCLGLKDKNVKGVGVLRFNGAAWETGWHFCPRDSLNVIINQPTSLFFEAFSSRGAIESPPLCTEANTRGEKGCGDRPNTNSLSALGGTFTDRMMCNCVGFHDGLTREHRTWGVNNCQLAPCQLGRPHPGHVIS